MYFHLLGPIFNAQSAFPSKDFLTNSRVAFFLTHPVLLQYFCTAIVVLFYYYCSTIVLLLYSEKIVVFSNFVLICSTTVLL